MNILNYKEIMALHNLMINKDIVISSVDNGGDIVIQNPADYVNEALPSYLI